MQKFTMDILKAMSNDKFIGLYNYYVTDAGEIGDSVYEFDIDTFFKTPSSEDDYGLDCANWSFFCTHYFADNVANMMQVLNTYPLFNWHKYIICSCYHEGNKCRFYASTNPFELAETYYSGNLVSLLDWLNDDDTDVDEYREYFPNMNFTKEYEVTVSFTVHATFRIEADSYEEAEDDATKIAQDKWDDYGLSEFDDYGADCFNTEDVEEVE